MLSVQILLAGLALASATPLTGLNALVPRSLISSNGICGAFNGTATCAGSAFGNCCSQFGWCGSSTAYCGSGCQSNYGTCGISTTLAWKSVGCYSDSTSARALNTSVLNPGGTVETCQSTCEAQGFTYSGMEYGAQCFCGTAILNNAAAIDPSNCNIACPQNAAEVCGGSNAISMYAVVPVWQSVGCYSDTTLKRTLAQSFNIAGNTVEKCQAVCQQNGYIYAGMEYGTQCFCGNSIDNGASLTSACGTACPGNSAEICGGANALSMYYLFQ
ncbi:Endochitinase-like family protein [Penicillium ucsense]|uniref:Endochitinase-like family protein n=1 Tax=Penicillium ucsense TaxID=2839758 RepID=A0A8J8VWC9_9EURO|nr:Endochitinase-like family protein [Penicillium ucsense]KAF7730476.1 Endochitinase-like family protein [Penicillium ucsense]